MPASERAAAEKTPVASERNALLDRDVRFPSFLTLETETMGHEIVKQINRAKPKVDDVALRLVDGWTKTESFAFEPYPFRPEAPDSDTVFSIRLKSGVNSQTLKKHLGSKIIMTPGIPQKGLFQPFGTDDGVTFLRVWTTRSDGTRALLRWAMLMDGSLKELVEFRESKDSKRSDTEAPQSVFKEMEDWVEQELHNKHQQNLADQCIEKIVEWQGPHGLCAKKQFPQLYLSNGQKNPHHKFVRDPETGTSSMTWSFGAKAKQHDSAAWTRELVKFTCTSDGQPSTIPPHRDDVALRRVEPWAEMLQCASSKYEDCLNNALRDAHFIESPLTPKQQKLYQHLSPTQGLQNSGSMSAADDSKNGEIEPYNLFRLLPEERERQLAYEMQMAEKRMVESLEHFTQENTEDHVYNEEPTATESFFCCNPTESLNSSMDEVRALLNFLSLGQYAASFEMHGYDSIQSIRGMMLPQLHIVMQRVGMDKPGHCERLSEWHASQSSHMCADDLSSNGHGSMPYPVYPQQQFAGYPNQWTVEAAAAWYADPWGPCHGGYNTWDQPSGYNTASHMSIIKMAKEHTGTRQVQQMLEPPWTEVHNILLQEISDNLDEFMFNQNAIFVVKACFKLLLDASAPEASEFSSVACTRVMEHWDSLVFGRTSGFSYKIVMWVMEFLYKLCNDDQLTAFCRKALEVAHVLEKSNFGHLLLQHCVLFTQKALMRCSSETESHHSTWLVLRSGFFDAAIRALSDSNAWDMKTNNASHFINKCLELLASDSRHKALDLVAHRTEIMRTVVEGTILMKIAIHGSGQFTAKRIYELATSLERRTMEQLAPTIHRPELRDLEKFKASLLPDELDLPRC